MAALLKLEELNQIQFVELQACTLSHSNRDAMNAVAESLKTLTGASRPPLLGERIKVEAFVNFINTGL